VPATFVYDGNYKRVRQTMAPSGGSSETIYSVYDASGAMVHRDNVTSNTQTDYVSLPGGAVRLDNSSTTYTYNDHLGSPVVGTYSYGAIRFREHYTPYGEKTIDDVDNRDDPGFTGHIQDDASGLTYMQARYYDPVIGRFLSVDPMTFTSMGNDPTYFNRYAYVGNDPVNYMDPNGMERYSLSLGWKFVKRVGIQRELSVTWDTEGKTLNLKYSQGPRVGAGAGLTLGADVSESDGFAKSDVKVKVGVDAEASVGVWKGQVEGSAEFSARGAVSGDGVINFDGGASDSKGLSAVATPGEVGGGIIDPSLALDAGITTSVEGAISFSEVGTVINNAVISPIDDIADKARDAIMCRGDTPC
jgi:RHS repeat-associated protein